MAHVIHLRCEKCGAPTSSDGGAWIRCPSCGTIAGFDFTGADSPQLAEFTRRAFNDSAGYVERWNKHNAEMDRAVALYSKSPAQALKISAEQAEFVLTETPWIMPAKSRDDAAAREAWRRWLGFELLHYRLSGRIQQLYGKLNQATAGIGFGSNENPLPAFQQMLAVLRELLQARVEAGSPPDPDGQSLECRMRVQGSQMVAAYMRMVSPELQLEVLRAIYGKDAIDVKAVGGQQYETFFDWGCPQCGLYSPQHVTSDKLTCPGCYCARRFVHDTQALAPLTVICHGCGSCLELAHAQMHAACGYCGSEVKRYTGVGEAQRQMLAKIRKAEIEKYGGDYEQMMADSNGLGVTPQTLAQRRSEGLARVAQWYHQFVTPQRVAGLARATVRPDGDAAADAMLAAAQSQAENEQRQGHGAKEAAGLLERARGKLARK